MSPKRSLLLLICSLFAATFAQAQGFGTPGQGAPPGMNPLTHAGTIMKSGQWREYKISGGEVDGAIFRWLWLETEERDGHQYRWVEMNAVAEGEQSTIKMLFDTDDPANPPVELIVKAAGQPAIRMPAGMIQATPGADTDSDYQEPVAAGTEQVLVPAGEFEATVYESLVDGRELRTYVAESLPGMVLVVGPNARMELIAYGDDGKPVITETPMSMQDLMN